MDVEFDGVRVERDGRVILDIPSLRLHGKRTTAILGPNGSGKTTLLRLIAGLERPRSGRVRAGGAAIPPRPRVAFVFQEQVFLRQTVRDNLELGLRLRGIDAAERRSRVEQAAALMGVDHLLTRQADRLSGGEGRRVSLARALCLRAPLVLLDEPLEGLDETSYSRLLDELPQVLAAFDATTVLVTHSRHEALRLADSLVVLVDGRVHAAGEKSEVVTNPRTAAVAAILGYAVLDTGTCRIAVPHGALRCGPGDVSFSLQVDDVIDLVESRELVGRIDNVRVRLVPERSDRLPQRGERLLIHAERYWPLSNES
jgi:ABC-type sugar transport system ATPase subunit